MSTISSSSSSTQKQFKWKLPQKSSRRDLNETLMEKNEVPQRRRKTVSESRSPYQTPEEEQPFHFGGEMKLIKANELIKSALQSNQIKPILKQQQTSLSSPSTTQLQQQPHRQRRISRRPSIQDEILFQKAVKYLSKIRSMNEKELKIEELHNWKKAVHTAAGVNSSFVGEDVGKKVRNQSNASLDAQRSNFPTTSRPPLRYCVSSSALQHKPFVVKRKPVPRENEDLEKKVEQYQTTSKEQELYTQMRSPKLRSDLVCTGKLHSLEVDAPLSAGVDHCDGNELQVTCDKFNSLIESPPPTSTRHSISFDTTEFELVAPRRMASLIENRSVQPNRSSTLPVTSDEIKEQVREHGFTKEICVDMMKQLPDVSGGVEEEETNNNNSSSSSSNKFREYESPNSSPISEQHSSMTSSEMSHGTTTRDHISSSNVDSSPRTCETSLEGHEEVEQGEVVQLNVNKELPTPKEEEEINQPSKLIPPTSGYRVRVPASMKKAIRDQRWQPSMKRLGLEMEEDDSDEDDFSLPHYPKRKNNQIKASRKNQMVDMLDFLASGPPE